MEAVVLAGGRGTRLQSVVSDVPKCMAPVAGKPFLQYLLKALEDNGFRHVILSLGYKHEAVTAWLPDFPTRMRISAVVERQPLLTGGAVRLALTRADEMDVFILNGDTFLCMDYREMLALHRQTKAKATVALKEMSGFDRYGVVDFDKDTLRIAGFKEKRPCRHGFINGGVYLMGNDALTHCPERFSLEKDFFEKVVHDEILTAYCTSGYFIDIGIPEDYARAREDFKRF